LNQINTNKMAVLKKKSFEVEVPQINFVTSLMAKSESEIIGRTLKIDLTRFLKGRSLEAKLLVVKEGDKLVGKFYALNLFLSYIRMMMRPGISYVEDSFVCSSKDDNRLRIKTFLITRKKVHRSVRNALREQCKELICAAAKDKVSDDLLSDVLIGKFQYELQKKLKKVYPLSLCEIRVFEKQRKI